MTKATKPVAREVQSARFGALIVTLTSAGIMYRIKNTRTTYGPIQHDHLFVQGAKLHADAKLAEKRTNRPTRVRRGRLTVGVR